LTLHPDAEHWKNVGRERGSDARKLRDADRRIGAVYMMGYVVEAYAKALARQRGHRTPKTYAGHDLIGLLELSGIKGSDLPPNLRKFAMERDVALRYQVSLPAGMDFISTYDGGSALVAYISKRLRRP
jgi:hypothetical protein